VQGRLLTQAEARSRYLETALAAERVCSNPPVCANCLQARADSVRERAAAARSQLQTLRAALLALPDPPAVMVRMWAVLC
jgi:hypothetical protein